MKHKQHKTLQFDKPSVLLRMQSIPTAVSIQLSGESSPPIFIASCLGVTGDLIRVSADLKHFIKHRNQFQILLFKYIHVS
jgi:hypothetical protein